MSNPLAVLQQIRQIRPEVEAEPELERCDLCTEALPEEHGHLVDLSARSLLCACRGCYLLFTSEGAGGGHYRAVPDRCLAFPDRPLSQGQWDALQIPVGLAFLFSNSSIDKLACFYPGPAGATESELPLDTWAEITAANPELAKAEPDTEAVLLRCVPGHGGAEVFIVPIDTCYELVGHLRRVWRGFDGGTEARAYIESYFQRLGARAR